MINFYFASSEKQSTNYIYQTRLKLIVSIAVSVATTAMMNTTTTNTDDHDVQ